VTRLGRQHEMTAPRTVTRMNGISTRPTTNETQPASRSQKNTSQFNSEFTSTDTNITNFA
jgi:hypothetical protein